MSRVISCAARRLRRGFQANPHADARRAPDSSIISRLIRAFYIRFHVSVRERDAQRSSRFALLKSLEATRMNNVRVIKIYTRFRRETDSPYGAGARRRGKTPAEMEERDLFAAETHRNG